MRRTRKIPLLLCLSSWTVVSSFLSPQTTVSKIGQKIQAVQQQEVAPTDDPPQQLDSPYTQISPYYRHDRHDNATAPLPPAPVLQAFLEDRWQARQDKNTNRIREIDHQLQTQYGIFVYDHPPIWTRQVQPPRAWQRKRVEIRDSKRKKAHGPRGHPLQRVGQTHETMLLEEPVIHAQLAQWMDDAAHNGTRQERAHAIRFELSLHGVFINSTSLEWTTNPKHNHGHQDTPTCTGHCPPILRTSIDGHTADDVRIKRLQRIEHLLERHYEASLTGNRDECIFLTWELLQCYGVEWSPRHDSWVERPPTRAKDSPRPRSTDHPDFHELLSQLASQSTEATKCTSINHAHRFCPPMIFYKNTSAWDSPMYQQSNASLSLPHHISARVRSLVQERIHKREESKYVEADAIRYELWEAYGVGINDRLQQYSVGGNFDKV